MHRGGGAPFVMTDAEKDLSGSPSPSFIPKKVLCGLSSLIAGLCGKLETLRTEEEEEGGGEGGGGGGGGRGGEGGGRRRKRRRKRRRRRSIYLKTMKFS